MPSAVLEAPGRDVQLAVELRGGNAAYWDCTAPEVIVSGPQGTGKTRAILERLHMLLGEYPGMRVLMCRKTLESLKQAALVTYQDQVLHPRDGVHYYGGSQVKPAQFTYPNGSYMTVTGLDRMDKAKSSEYDIIYINEATEIDEADWEQLSGRCRNFRLPFQQIVGDCNPGPPAHWILRREREGVLVHYATLHEDNPAYWDERSRMWTPEGAAYMARLESYTGVRYLRLRRGIWAAEEGIVFEHWHPGVHVVDDAWLEARHILKDGNVSRIGTRRVVAGVDWGFTHPGSITIWAIDGDGRMYDIHEVYQTGKTIDWWLPVAVALQHRYVVEKWVCDPSEPGYIAQFRSRGLNASGGNNDIRLGINEVNERMQIAGDGRARLYVRRGALVGVDRSLAQAGKPTCLAEEIPVYVWDEKSKVSEKPVDANNHSCDPMRYVAMELKHATRKQARGRY